MNLFMKQCQNIFKNIIILLLFFILCVIIVIFIYNNTFYLLDYNIFLVDNKQAEDSNNS